MDTFDSTAAECAGCEDAENGPHTCRPSTDPVMTTAQGLLSEFLGSDDSGLYVTLTRQEMLQAILDAVRAGQAL